MKLRVLLKKLKAAADELEQMAQAGGLPEYVAENSRRKIRRLRIDRPAKRRVRKWTQK
jgi:hypothetical protein